MDSKGVTAFCVTRAIQIALMGAYLLTKLEGWPLTGAVPKDMKESIQSMHDDLDPVSSPSKSTKSEALPPKHSR